MSLKKRFALFTLAFLISLVAAVWLMDAQLDAVKLSRRSIREDQGEAAMLFEVRRLLESLREAVEESAERRAPWPPARLHLLKTYASLLESIRKSIAADGREEGERVEAEGLELLLANADQWREFCLAERDENDIVPRVAAERADDLFREGDHAAARFLQGVMLELTEALETLETSEERVNRMIFEWSAVVLCFWAVAWIAFGYGMMAPVARLREVVRRLRERDFEAADSLALKGSGEIAELTAAFAEMSNELRDFTRTLEERVAERTRQLEDSRRRLSRMLNHLPDCVALADAEESVETANTPWRRMFGQGERSPFDEILALPADPAGGRRWRGPDGSERVLELSRLPLDPEENGGKRLWLEHARDATLQREIEAALASSQKLAALGRLSAGIAHEINNPLASIGACAEGLLKRLDKSSQALLAESELFRDYLATIRDEVARCKDITEKLLDHSRQRREEAPSEFDAAEIAAGVVRLVEPLAARKDVKIAFETEGDAKLVGNARALNQICLNLALNAVEACPENGRVEISVRGSEDGVLLEASDDGAGIAEEDLAHLFEPFFTKRAGGTGLGLFVCQGIAEAMGGKIVAASEGEGKGARFSLRLPRRRAAVQEGGVPSALPASEAPQP